MKREQAAKILQDAYAKGVDLDDLKGQAASLLDEYQVVVLDLLQAAGLELPLTERDRIIIRTLIGSYGDLSETITPLMSGWLGLSDPEFFREVLG